jgi:glycosyltransferase involved in cell wall biosynthesis
MRVVVTLEQRFDRTPDGTVWTSTDFSHEFWQRYLTVFDAVRVVARVRDVASVPSGHRPSTGPGVDFVAIPYYHGPGGFLRVAPAVVRTARAAVGREDAVILRIASLLADCIVPVLRHRGHPYAVEVVGDPHEVFAPGAVRHPLRPFFRAWFTRGQRRQCAGACAALYVTRAALQRRYPCPAGEVGVSDVELEEVVPARSIRTGDRRTQLVLVGTLEQLYKSPDVLIGATARCVRDGLDLGLSFVGDGKYRPSLEAQCRELGISDRVTFHGTLPSGGAVRARLDEADLFVLASRQEGLPRAMVEAMARGLPCIGSTVGGIPELLAEEDLVPAGDVDALARKIREVVTRPGRMAEMSARNLRTAREYTRGVLQGRRTEFYRRVREATAAWLRSGESR